MAETVWFISYKLVKGASVQDYLNAAEQVRDEVLAKQKGYISWKVLNDGDTWVDVIAWKTPEDAKNSETAGEANSITQKYYSLIDMESCKMNYYTVEKSF